MDTPEASVWTPEENVPSETFASGAVAEETLFEYAIRNGFTLVAEDSYSSSVTFACAQGGEKRSHNSGGLPPQSGLRPLRTKKVGCSYEIKLVRSGRDRQSWSVIDCTATHRNHEPLPPERISALPAARRYLKEKHSIFEKIEEAYGPRVSTGSVWESLQQAHGWLTFKDVDNIISEIKKERLNGLTEIKAFHAKLKNEAVVSDSLKDEENRLVRLFFSPKASRHLIQPNPEVLMLDCTYKTNA